jgi:hypothetical protein
VDGKYRPWLKLGVTIAMRDVLARGDVARYGGADSSVRGAYCSNVHNGGRILRDLWRATENAWLNETTRFSSSSTRFSKREMRLGGSSPRSCFITRRALLRVNTSSRKL